MSIYNRTGDPHEIGPRTVRPYSGSLLVAKELQLKYQQ